MVDNQMHPVAVFRTGQLWQIDMAVNALKEAHIPYFTQEETAGGVRLAMPVMPTPGPGVWWSLFVSESEVEETRRVLSNLPFDIKTNPDAWDFTPAPEVKQVWKTFIVIGLILFIVSLIIGLIR
jgi:hypothetical protein